MLGIEELGVGAGPTTPTQQQAGRPRFLFWGSGVGAGLPGFRKETLNKNSKFFKE